MNDLNTNLMDDDSKSQGIIDFYIKDFHKFHEWPKEKKILSDPVMVRSLPWKILIQHKIGQNKHSQHELTTDIKLNDQENQSIKHHNIPEGSNAHHIGFFLQCNGESTSPKWSCHARAELWFIGTVPEKSKHNNISHNFHCRENDWGFANFIYYNTVMDPKSGLLHINPDTGFAEILHARVYLIADPPHGSDWDSKSLTGFVGLRNQGATCYMNSLLQALYFTNLLRKSVYAIPIDEEILKQQSFSNDSHKHNSSTTSGNTVALALQRVFYELQHSSEAVGTKKLTNSFGWQTLDSFMQHDAQELCRVLLDNLENKMKQLENKDVSDIIPTLFCGKMRSFIRCKHVDVCSNREENFYDIQLKVKGNKDVYEAFKEYTQVETLDGANCYDAGEHGLQPATKGMIFLQFPPVLYLHLMRFQYDFTTDSNVKINDRFEFSYDLDLKEFLAEDCSNLDAEFLLHSVLVHSGDHHGGHYVAYINPAGDGKWFRFDDDVVNECTAQEAIQLNYGNSNEAQRRSMEESMSKSDLAEANSRKLDLSDENRIWDRLNLLNLNAPIFCNTNAYMLVYVKKSKLSEILCPVDSRTDISPSLHTTFENEQIHRDNKQKENDATNQSLFLTTFSEEYLGMKFCYPTYNSFDQISNKSRFRYARNCAYENFYDEMRSNSQLPPNLLLRAFLLVYNSGRPTFQPLNEVNLQKIQSQERSFEITHFCFDQDSQLELKAFEFLNTHLFFDKKEPQSAEFAMLFFVKYVAHNCRIYAGFGVSFLHVKMGEIFREFIQRLELDIDSVAVVLDLEYRSLSSMPFLTDWKNFTLKEYLIKNHQDPVQGMTFSIITSKQTTSPRICNVLFQPYSEFLFSFNQNNMINDSYNHVNDNNHSKIIPNEDQIDSESNSNQLGKLPLDVERQLEELLMGANTSSLTILRWSQLLKATNLESDKSPLFIIPFSFDSACSELAKIVEDKLSCRYTNSNLMIPELEDHVQLVQPPHRYSHVSDYLKSCLKLENILANMSQQTILHDENECCEGLTHKLESRLSVIPKKDSSEAIDGFICPCSVKFTQFIRLFFRISDEPISKIESQLSMRVKFLAYDQISKGQNGLREISVRIPKMAKGSDLLNAVYDALQANPIRKEDEKFQKDHLRIWDTNLRPIGEFPLDKLITIHQSLRVDEIHPDDRKAVDGDQFVRVAHFSSDMFNFHGLPFAILVQQTDTAKGVAEKIRQRLDVPHSTFANWKIFLINNNKQIPIDINTTEKISDFSIKQGDLWIGLDHKPIQQRPIEKPIKIHN